MTAPIGGGGYGSSADFAAAMRAQMRADMREDMRIGGEPGVKSDVSKVGAGNASNEVREAGGFGAVLEKTVLSANAKEHEAVSKAQALADGRSDDLHGTMITMKEAEISMKLVGNVRDKLLDAFHELWRINV